eukprot:g3149.t1
MDQQAINDYNIELDGLGGHPDKAKINLLSMLADDFKEFSSTIVSIIHAKISSVHPSCKLPILYTIDSILKNVRGPYRAAFGAVIVGLFSNAYIAVDTKSRGSMMRVLRTWQESSLFPESTLSDLERLAKTAPPATLQRPAPPPTTTRPQTQPLYSGGPIAGAGVPMPMPQQPMPLQVQMPPMPMPLQVPQYPNAAMPPPSVQALQLQLQQQQQQLHLQQQQIQLQRHYSTPNTLNYSMTQPPPSFVSPPQLMMNNGQNNNLNYPPAGGSLNMNMNGGMHMQHPPPPQGIGQIPTLPIINANNTPFLKESEQSFGPDRSALESLLHGMYDSMKVQPEYRLPLDVVMQQNPSLIEQLRRHWKEEQGKKSSSEANVNHTSSNPNPTEIEKKMMVQPSLVPSKSSPSYEALIEKLYNPAAIICRLCGLRFKKQSEHAAHLDWHFRMNRRKATDNSSTSRMWFVAEETWSNGIALDSKELSGEQTNTSWFDIQAKEEADKRNKEKIEANGGEIIGEGAAQSGDELSAVFGRLPGTTGVPLDENCSSCVVCGEMFERHWFDGGGDPEKVKGWIWKNTIRPPAMYGNPQGRIYHRECFESLTSSPRGGGDDAVDDNGAFISKKRTREEEEEEEEEETEEVEENHKNEAEDPIKQENGDITIDKSKIKDEEKNESEDKDLIEKEKSSGKRVLRRRAKKRVRY